MRARPLARGPIRAGQASRPAPVATQAQADRSACSRNGRASCQSGAEQAGIRPAGGDRVRPAAPRSARYSASGWVGRESGLLRPARGALFAALFALRPSLLAALRHARRCPALVPGPLAARLPEAAPTAQSQRDGGSHGAGARQPSPGRCHVQLRRRRRLSGASHSYGHTGGARAAPAAPGGTWTGTGDRGKGRTGKKQVLSGADLGM